MPKTLKNLGSANIVSDILDLGNLCQAGEDPSKVLAKLVDKIAKIMGADACSLYLMDEQSKDLVLKATKGLNTDSIDKVRMNVGEGLVGKTLEWLKPVSMSSAQRSKMFKHFPETGEDKYASFLSVPLIYNRNPIGVVVIQSIKSKKYSSKAAHLLLSLAIPAVNVIEKSKLLGTLDKIKQKAEASRAIDESSDVRIEGITHQGIGSSPGISIARVRILSRQSQKSYQPQSTEKLPPEIEKMRVLEALRWVAEEIRAVQSKAKKKFGMEELSIFDAYQMILESDVFRDQILDEIDAGKIGLEAVEAVILRYTEELSTSDDEYIKERIFDIQDIGRKIKDHLIYGEKASEQMNFYGDGSILLSDFWSISDLVELDIEKTKGILCPVGGASSHVSILAKSLGLPSIMGLGSFSDKIKDGDTVIMDGSSGMVVLNPPSHIRKIYQRELNESILAKKRFQKYVKKKATPKGGKRISIGANMGMVAHADQAIGDGAEEIGLYRTEFPFLIRRSFPTEEEQFNLYKKVLKGMDKRAVSIRTLDIGGDKYLPYFNFPDEENPCLGWRSIRISLEREDLFRIQLRALLRASVFGKLKILFPMISSLDEMIRVKEIIEDVKKELKAEKKKIASSIPIGVMIEVPSAVEIAEALIEHVDFFSIGSNDLVQYLLAVDRNNAKVASLFNPLHPAVLRVIGRVVKIAQKHQKPVSICGEMASHTLCIPILAGMGVDLLSLSSPYISKVKSLICQLDQKDLKRLVSAIMKLDRADEIEEAVKKLLIKRNLQEYIPKSSQDFLKE